MFASLLAMSLCSNCIGVMASWRTSWCYQFPRAYSFMLVLSHLLLFAGTVETIKLGLICDDCFVVAIDEPWSWYKVKYLGKLLWFHLSILCQLEICKANDWYSYIHISLTSVVLLIMDGLCTATVKTLSLAASDIGTLLFHIFMALPHQ